MGQLRLSMPRLPNQNSRSRLQIICRW
ncbi:hypothetical protein PM8797T_21073 [Gimesia maris DSM 8797]|nr:hypothetical protein PM8797T_21073 [Gimesia maris DSM 8797]